MLRELFILSTSKQRTEVEQRRGDGSSRSSSLGFKLRRSVADNINPYLSAVLQCLRRLLTSLAGDFRLRLIVFNNIIVS